MKHNITSITKLLVVAVVFLMTIGSTAQGQLLLTDDFSYTVGTTAVSNGWTAHSGGGSNSPLITTPGLTYSGYQGSGVGNAVTITNNGEDISKIYTQVTSGSVYAAFMVSPNNASTGAAGDYHFHLRDNAGAFFGRVHFRKAANGNFQFGISKGSSSTAANISYSDSIYTAGSTHLLIVKYKFTAGTTNDTAYLFIDPTISMSEPSPTLTAKAADIVLTDATEIKQIGMRQNSTSNNITFDGIRVGTSWVSVLYPAGDATSDIQSSGNEVSNINYAAYQSASISTTSDAVRVWSFTIRDGAGSSDADSYGTELTSLTISKGSGNGVSNWANALRKAALFDGSTKIAEVSVTGETIAFSGLSGSNVTAADGGSKTLDLYVTFESSVTDNEQFQFEITNANVSATVYGGSSFSAFSAQSSSTTADANRIEVTATKLVFTTNPPASVAQNNQFSAAVTAKDANDNVDVDYATNVTIGVLTGTGIVSSASNLSKAPASGVASWNDLSYDVAETGVQLKATSGSLTDGTSSNIDVVALSAASDIVAGGDTEPATISSLIDTQGEQVQVFDITVRDGGGAADGDGVGTNVTSLSFKQGSSNQASDWSQYIQGAELFDGVTSLGTGTVNATSIEFSGSPLFSTADDGNKTVQLKLYLNSTLPAGADGKIIQLQINQNTDATTNTTGSLFAGSGTTVTSGSTAIDVATTELHFGATIAGQTSGAAFATSVYASDANGNKDADFTSTVDLTIESGSGALSGTTSAAASAGTASFSGVIITGTGDHVLRAVSGTDTTLSNIFNVAQAEAAGVFKVANIAGDTLYWDNASTWTMTSGYDVSGLPDANDDVIIDNEFKAGSYVLVLRPTRIDTAKSLTVGYIGNSNSIEVLVPTSSTIAPQLVVGDNTAGNYDVTILAGGTVINASGATTGNPISIRGFNPANDTMWIRAGGKLVHATARSSSYMYRTSKRVDGDYGTVEYDVPGTSAFFVAGSGAYYPNLVFSATRAGGTRTYTVSNSADPNVANNPLHVKGNLTINAGDTLLAGSGGFAQPLGIYGNLVNYGTLISGSPSTTKFMGVDVQEIIGNPIDFTNGLIVDNVYNVNLQSNVTVSAGTATMTNGHINTASNTLFLNPAGSLDETGGIIAGKVSATRTLSQNSNETFGSLGLEINALSSAPGATTVDRTTGSFSSGNGNQSIRRYFDVTTAGAPPYNATVGFKYDDSELNGNPEADLFLHYSNDGGNTWKGKTGTNSTSFNKVTTTTINSLNSTRFTLASTSSPLYTTHTIVMKKFEDNDGDLETPGTAKKWYMELYENSIAPENLINALNLSTVTTANLPAGTYICKEADSTGWIHAGHIVDNGFTRVVHTDGLSYDTIVVSGGVSGTFEFYNSRTSSITINKYRDLDGDINTTGDQTTKAWGFTLYRDTVGGTPVGTGSGTTVTFSDLASGMYIIMEADSAGWFRAGASTPYDTLVLAGNAQDTVNFYNVKGNSLLVRKWVDADANLATTNDQTQKSWYLEVRKGSPTGTFMFSGVAPGIISNQLADGLYYASEADSGWVSLGFNINGQYVDNSAGQFIASSDLSNGQSDTIDFFNAYPAYGATYRTLNPDSIAMDKDNAGKLGKSVKAKADKVQFTVNLAAATEGVDGLYAQFSVLIDTSFDFYTVPASTISEVSGSKLTKFTFTFSSPLASGDSVKIYGFGKKGSIQKVPSYWWSTGATAGTKLKNASVTNTLRLPMPNRLNVIEETFAAGAFPGPDGKGGMVIGVNQAVKDSAKKYGWVLLKKAADVVKTLGVSSKTGMNLHDGTPRGLDSVVAGKAMKSLVGKYTSLPPTKQDNILFANLVALKASIAASAAGKTPAGFGDLIFQDTSTTPNPLNGLTLSELSAEADTMMTGYANRTFEDAAVYENLSNSVRRVLDAFEGEIDTLKFGGGTILTGAARLVDCPILQANMNATPSTIIASGRAGQTPETFALYQNYPNPFNPATTIRFDLPIVSTVTLKVYNLLGQEVVTLLDKQLLEDGAQEYTFDASSLASGVYFYRITAESVDDDGIANTYTQVMKMLLMK